MGESNLGNEETGISAAQDRARRFYQNVASQPTPPVPHTMDQPTSLHIPTSDAEDEAHKAEVLTKANLERAALAKKKGLPESALVEIQNEMENAGVPKWQFWKSVKHLLGMD